jgi:hypothetical protein
MSSLSVTVFDPGRICSGQGSLSKVVKIDVCRRMQVCKWSPKSPELRCKDA